MYTMRSSTLIVGPRCSGKTQTIKVIKHNNPNVNFVVINRMKLATISDDKFKEIGCAIISELVSPKQVELFVAKCKKFNIKFIIDYQFSIDDFSKDLLDSFSSIIQLNTFF